MPSLRGQFIFFERLGDLFSANGCLVHCVSADFHLGSGIAKEFLRRFPEIKTLVGTKVGEVGTVPVEKYFVYNLVTKPRYFDKPTYESLKDCLLSLKNHTEVHYVNSISMPRIGCGLDRLDWLKVKKIIFDVFKHSKISVYVYSLT